MASSSLPGGAGTDFVDIRRTQGQTSAVVGTPANYHNVNSMRTRLLAIGGIYTAAYLDKMTSNDMVYALRLNDDAAGI